MGSIGHDRVTEALRSIGMSLLVTLALHLGILGAVKIAHSKGDEPLVVPRDFVVARMVKLGKPREKFWLPRITQPPRPKAPPAVIKLSDDPNAAKAPVEAPRPDNPATTRPARLDARRYRSPSAPARSRYPTSSALYRIAENALVSSCARWRLLWGNGWWRRMMCSLRSFLSGRFGHLKS